jgi:hypothetical protein
MSKVERREVSEDARDWEILTNRVFACCSWCARVHQELEDGRVFGYTCTLDQEPVCWCEQACACFA